MYTYTSLNIYFFHDIKLPKPNSYLALLKSVTTFAIKYLCLVSPWEQRSFGFDLELPSKIIS